MSSATRPCTSPCPRLAPNPCPFPRTLPGSIIKDAQLMQRADIAAFAEPSRVASFPPPLVDECELCHAFWPRDEPRAFPQSRELGPIPIKLGPDCCLAELHLVGAEATWNFVQSNVAQATTARADT